MFEVIGHSSTKIVYPKPLSYIFMSPALHWLHHSDNPNHHDCNFSMHFCFWDKIFGTYLGEENLKDITSFGVGETQYNKYNPFYSNLILPFIKLSYRIRKILSFNYT